MEINRKSSALSSSLYTTCHFASHSRMIEQFNTTTNIAASYPNIALDTADDDDTIFLFALQKICYLKKIMH